MLETAAISLFFLQIAVMLGLALLCGQVMRYFNQPAVLGELLGGILLGPTIFGLILPEYYSSLFPGIPEIAQNRTAVIRIGMLFFLFVAGLEVNLSQVRQHQKSVVLVSFLGCLIPFLFGFGAVWLFPDMWGAPNQHKWIVLAAFIGTSLSISALPVITRILMDLRLLQKEFGSIVLSAATINDLFGWALFALLLGAINPSESGESQNVIATLGGVLVFSILILVFGRWVGQPILGWARKSLIWPSGFLGVSAVFILIAAAIAEALHIHAVFGAFLIGIALYPAYDDGEGFQAKEIVYQFVITFFAPLYFVSVGLEANFALHFDFVLVLSVTLIATIGKVLGAGLGAWIGGRELREALAMGFAMNARGAMEIILASVALDQGLIDERIFVALVIMALVTSMISGPALQWLLHSPQE